MLALFRYGARGARPRPGALIALLRRIRALPGLRLVQTDHANVISAAQYADDELAEVGRLLRAPGRGHGFIWVNLGVETAAGELLAANGGGPKMQPFRRDEWGDLCCEQVRRLAAAGFFPLVSLVLGLPGETPAHVEETTRWVEGLDGLRAAVFPIFHAPIAEGARAFGRADMTAAHWRLFRACYRLNFRWVPALCWDNQSGAGVALWRRALLQGLGRLQKLWWKGLFVWRSGTLR